ncbi:APC family permease [Saccharopolyspora sp. WRP15-2]|uniref:APC family permease n=1 Tax=Saccharopolyspora oryzae TaxID=2997343 RepID=A0ABT4UQD4_9PSEU|nr:APC family permease [Saccharopolyspora oryzae]MDA3623907.1 APC family permease [Saccharopolyspora oryzae]
MASVDQSHATRSTDEHFKRRMSLQAAMFIGVGGQIGSGWLFAVLSAAGIAGPSALISWLIGGALTMLIALAWMEVGTAIPVSGAIVRYPYLSNGGLAGWIMGLSYWLANISLPAIEAVASLTYLGGLFPQLGLLTTRDGVSMLSWPRGILLGIALMLVFLAINLFGVKLLSEANRWVTWWKIIIPVATFLLLFLTFDGDNLTSYGFFGDEQHGGPGAMLEAVAVSGIAFALMGFRGVIDFGGEVKRPSRNIPLGTIGCVLIPLGIYLGLQLAFLGAINWADAGVVPGDWVGLANSPWAEGPLAAALHASGYAALGAFVSMLLLDAILSPGAAGYIYLGSGARVGYGLAVNKFFPQIMTRVNRHGVPAVSAIVSFGIGCLFFLPAPSWYRLVGFISSALVLSTLAASVALVVMRRTAPSLRRPFRLPAAGFLAPLGFAAATLIIYWCGFVTLYNLVTVLLGGMAVYAVFFSCQRGWTRRGPAVVLASVFLACWAYVTGSSGFLLAPEDVTTPDGSWPVPHVLVMAALCAGFLTALHLMSPPEGRQHLRGGHWLVFLLLMLLGVSAIGEYGPATPVLAFPMDSIAALAVGVLAYFWAVATGFRTPEMSELEDDKC